MRARRAANPALKSAADGGRLADMESIAGKQVGVLGLGIIGGTWARHFNDDGMLAGCWNRTAREQFPGWMSAPREVVRAARVIFIVVADPPAVEQVLDSIAPELTARHVIIQSSTIDPISSGRFSLKVAETGARYIEAPFTGSKPAAEARKIVFYLGGDKGLADEIDPILARVSEARFHIGTAARAATLKLAMNMQIAIIGEALCESLSVARAAGIDDDKFFGAMRKNIAWSGLAALKEPKLRVGDFAPQFSAKHMHKDIRLALATSLVKPLPLTEKVATCFEKIEARGLRDMDFIALLENFRNEPV